MMGIVVDAFREPDDKGFYGHHGIDIARGSDNLVTHFKIMAPQVRLGLSNLDPKEGFLPSDCLFRGQL
jgi:hypothetical protein